MQLTTTYEKYNSSTIFHETRNIKEVRFQVLTAASMMFRAVFWVVLPYIIPDDGGSTHL
jgi:hypothetical protein